MKALKYFFVWCLGGLPFVGAVDIYEGRSYISNKHNINAKVLKANIQKYQIKNNHINSGDPKIQLGNFSDSFDYRSRFGIFESAPSSWRWHFDTNESIYILTGQVGIDYDGKHLILNPGDIAHFEIGTDAIFNTTMGFKKIWFTHNPSLIVLFTSKVQRKILSFID